jgi:hypothetical protein
MIADSVRHLFAEERPFGGPQPLAADALPASVQTNGTPSIAEVAKSRIATSGCPSPMTVPAGRPMHPVRPLRVIRAARRGVGAERAGSLAAAAQA